MKYIDQSGQGNTLLILTDAESRVLREHLHFIEQATNDPASSKASMCLAAINNGIARGTAKMAEEAKAERKARVKK